MSSSKIIAHAKGKYHVDMEDVKMKGKAIVREIPAQDKMDNSSQNFLVTLDIFAGCGCLLHGLEKSGTYGVPVIHAFFGHVHNMKTIHPKNIQISLGNNKVCR